jgi:predicted transcriptional regulator
MLDALKNFDAKRADLAELVELSAYGRALLAEFETLSVEAPEWATENLAAVRRELKSRNQDRLAAKLKAAKARLETLKTVDEKRTGVQAEIAALEAQLQQA